MTEPLRRVRNSRGEKSGVRRHDHRATSVNSSVCSDAEYEMVEDEDAFVEAPWRQERTGQTFFELEIRRYRLLQNARLSREERQVVLAGTRNDTEYTAIVTQLRSAWDDQDLSERDRGSKSFGKGRTVHFAEADTEWYAEQIAHSISGDASELEVTWSFDPVEAIWWCGVLDPSIPAPDVMDWSEDWSYSESSSCAEDVFPEQSQVLALTADDASSPECVQQAEVLVAEANRTLAQARSAVASAKQNRSGFFPPSNVSSSREGKGKGNVKGKSKDSSCLICGRRDHLWRQCPERHPKGSGKGGKNGSRTFYLGAAWGLDSELFVLQADVVLDSGATETAGGVEAVQILVDAVKQGFFSDSRVEVDSLDRPWFRFANGHWGRALSRVWLLTPMGWISIYTLEAENVPVLAGMNLLENHDISFRRHEFLVYVAERHTRSVPLRRSPSGHRILNLLSWGQRAASCFSHATASDFIEDPREQKLNVSSACMFGGCLSILFLVFVITRILHLSLRTDHGLFPSRHSQMMLFFLMKICASHLHFSPGCVPLKHV